MATDRKTTKAAQGSAADAPKATYLVTSPLEHDLELYEIGSEIELTEAEAAPLLEHTVKPKQAS